MSSRLIEIITLERFKEITDNKQIIVSSHAIDHLSDLQRKLYKLHDLIFILEKEIPKLIALQKNGRYTAYYGRKWGYLKLIISIQESKVIIITFVNVDTLPRLK